MTIKQRSALVVAFLLMGALKEKLVEFSSGEVTQKSVDLHPYYVIASEKIQLQ